MLLEAVLVPPVLLILDQLEGWIDRFVEEYLGSWSLPDFL